MYNNIARVKVWREFSTEVKRNRMNVSFERQRRAKKIRESNFVSKLKQNVMYLKKWDVYREKRAVEEKEL